MLREFDFQIPTGVNGDCYETAIRPVEEIASVYYIIQQRSKSLRAPEGQGVFWHGAKSNAAPADCE